MRPAHNVIRREPMSKTFLSRLAMLEVLDAAGPLTISELAHRSGLDTPWSPAPSPPARATAG